MKTSQRLLLMREFFVVVLHWDTWFTLLYSPVAVWVINDYLLPNRITSVVTLSRNFSWGRHGSSICCSLSISLDRLFTFLTQQRLHTLAVSQPGKFYYLKRWFVGNLECSRKCCYYSQAWKARYSSTGWRSMRHCLVQSKISYWIHQANQQQFWEVELQNQNIHPSCFQWLSGPCKKISRCPVHALHYSRQQRICWPTDFCTHVPHSLQCIFWGEGTRESCQLTFLNEHTVLPEIWYGHHGDSEKAIVHVAMVQHGTTAGS